MTTCEICEEIPSLTVRDHCHRHGQIRGVVCYSCNSLMGRIDRGFVPHVERVALSLLLDHYAKCTACPSITVNDLGIESELFPVLPKEKTNARAVRIEDSLWQAAKAKAAQRGETVTDVIRRALQRYVGTKKGEPR